MTALGGVRAMPLMNIDGTNGTNGEPSSRRLSLVCAADVRMQPVSYVWDGRLPLAKVTGIEGVMGRGKTQLMIKIIAAVTRGGPLPGQAETPSGEAILISLEDANADTLVPRLRAADANLFRCHLFDGGMFNLDGDCEALRFEIERLGASIVALDPFTAMLGATVNSYKDQDVRRILAPLAQVAEDTGAAIVFTRHFRKGGGTAEDAGGGSVGIGAACRSVLRVDRDPEDPERYLLSSVKSSVSKRPPTLGYRIEGVTLPTAEGTIETSQIIWDGESSWTADTLASHSMSNDERPRAEEAQEWLRDALHTGPRPAKELFRAAEIEGIPKRTLQRAADVLRVTKERKGFGEGSLWSLSLIRANGGLYGANDSEVSIRANDGSFTPSKSMAPMGMNGANEGEARRLPTRTIERDGAQIAQEFRSTMHGDRWIDLGPAA